MKIDTNVANVSAFVTVKKDRKKVYHNYGSDGINETHKSGGTIYLNNGDEFEIELFNGSRDKVLFDIEVNGKSIGSGGLVIRPGERHFLDRFLDDSKKFLFETYEVSGKSQEVAEAIADNGGLKITVYKEHTPQPEVKYPWARPTINDIEYPNWWGGNNIYLNKPLYRKEKKYTSNLGNNTELYSCDNIEVRAAPDMLKCRSINFCNTRPTGYIQPTGELTTSSVNMDLNDITLDFMDLSDIQPENISLKMSAPKSDKIETGRIERGGESDQKFKSVKFVGEDKPIVIFTYKLLPTSQKPVTVTELNQSKRFCPFCGEKTLKNGYKFCPKCGKEL